MPIRERARRVGRSGKIGQQPRVLRRSGACVDVAVQRNDVPAGDIEAVVAAALRSRGIAEVVVVASGAGGDVVVIARTRADARLVPAPGGLEAVGILRGRTD